MIWDVLPVVRDLRQRLAEAERTRLLAEDRLGRLEEECGRAREDAAVAIRNERHTYQSTINIDIQQKYGIALYPDAAKLPPATGSKEPAEPPAVATTIRQLENKARDEFAEEWLRRNGTPQ